MRSHRKIIKDVRTGDGVREGLGGTKAALGVPRQHNLDLDTEHTLSEQDVANGVVNKVLGGLTRVDHEAVGELHGLGTGSTQLAGDDNLTALSARLHNEAKDTVACSVRKKQRRIGGSDDKSGTQFGSLDLS